MYYPSGANKGADQLCSYCIADLRLCFRICKFWPIYTFRKWPSNIPILSIFSALPQLSEAVLKPVLVIGSKWAKWVMREFPDEKFDPKLVKMGPEKEAVKGQEKLDPGRKKKKDSPAGEIEFPPDQFPDN